MNPKTLKRYTGNAKLIGMLQFSALGRASSVPAAVPVPSTALGRLSLQSQCSPEGQKRPRCSPRALGKPMSIPAAVTEPSGRPGALPLQSQPPGAFPLQSQRLPRLRAGTIPYGGGSRGARRWHIYRERDVYILQCTNRK